MRGLSRIEEKEGRFVLVMYDENNIFGREVREFASEEDAKEFESRLRSIVESGAEAMNSAL